MELNELKEQIESKTGIPSKLLTSDTADGCITMAKQLIDFRDESKEQKPITAKEAFTTWMEQMHPSDHRVKTDSEIIDDLVEQYRLDNGGYPSTKEIQDGGSVNLPEHKTAKQELADFMNEKSAFDPFKHGGWKHIK